MDAEHEVGYTLGAAVVVEYPVAAVEAASLAGVVDADWSAAVVR